MVELKARGTELHAATVVGDTVGDPFKDTSSVAMNPVIKFTTLFGLLPVKLAVRLASEVVRASATCFQGRFLWPLGDFRLTVGFRDADSGGKGPAVTVSGKGRPQRMSGCAGAI